MDNLYFLVTPKQQSWRKTLAYDLIQFILCVCAGAGALFIGLLILFAIAPKSSSPCDSPKSFECLDRRVQECVSSEAYTKDQCVILIGGNK